MTARIDEIAPDLYRICLYVPAVRPAVQSLPGQRRRAAAVSHGHAGDVSGRARRGRDAHRSRERFAGSAGATSRWTSAARSTSGWRAPNATPVCGELGAMINIADFSNRPPRGLKPDEILETGRHRFRFVPTPHLPHGWDAGMLFEESDRCCCARTCCTRSATSSRSRPATSSAAIAMRSRPTSSPRADGLRAVHGEHETAPGTLAGLKPRILAAMHGSTFVGDGGAALIASGDVIREVGSGSLGGAVRYRDVKMALKSRRKVAYD